MCCHYCHSSHSKLPLIIICTQYSGWQAIDNENPSGVRGRVLIGNDSAGLVKTDTSCKDDDATTSTVCATTKESCDGDPYEFTCEEVGNGLSCNTFSVYCESSCDGAIEEVWVEKKD